MPKVATITEAKAQLSALVRQVRESGEPVLIGKVGEPEVMLVPYRADRRPRDPGGWEGQVVIEEFDAADETVTELFESSRLTPDP